MDPNKSGGKSDYPDQRWPSKFDSTSIRSQKVVESLRNSKREFVFTIVHSKCFEPKLIPLRIARFKIILSHLSFFDESISQIFQEPRFIIPLKLLFSSKLSIGFDSFQKTRNFKSLLIQQILTIVINYIQILSNCSYPSSLNIIILINLIPFTRSLCFHSQCPDPER
jgi:hypothetical protein